MEQRLYQAAMSGANDASLSEIHQEGRDNLVTSYLNASPLHLAALRGNLEFVKIIVHQIPELAEAVDSRRRTPLHLASAEGHVNVVQELVSANVDMSTSRDIGGRNPLHVAVVKGHINIVKELVSANVDVCTYRDLGGRNPLHVAAVNGNVDILEVLLQACPHAANDRVDRDQTILHLCVKHDQVQALEVLLKNPKLKELVNAKDADGNTILHLAVADANFETVKALYDSNKIDMDIKNMNGYTALNMLSSHLEQVEGGNNVSTSLEDSLECQVQREKLLRIKDFFLESGVKGEAYVKEEHWLNDKKESINVAAALIATVAFQAMMSPPGGFWQDSSNGHTAGEVIMSYKSPRAYTYFLRFNTAAFLMSMSTILILSSNLTNFITVTGKRLDKLPLAVSVTLSLAVVSLATAYAVSINVVTPYARHKSLTYPTIGFVIYWIVMMAVGVYVPGILKSLSEEPNKVNQRTSRTSEHTMPGVTPHGVV